MNILIVENEPNYLDTLEMFIDELGYDLCGSAQNGDDALKLFKAHKPDVVLMDIHLDGSMSGIEVAHLIQEIQKTPVIFITSFDDSRTFERAKKTFPFGYIIKPFKEADLARSIELAVINTPIHNINEIDEHREGDIAEDYFFIKNRNKLQKLPKSDIDWIQVEDKYCRIFSQGKSFLIRLSLKEMLEKLDQNYFIQIHRSYIVNSSKIDSIEPNNNLVYIAENELPISRSYKEALLTKLNIL